MKLLKMTGLILLITINVNAQSLGGGEANPNLKTHSGALKKFQDNRFGMFIHWGPVTLRGKEISWSRGNQIQKEDYDNLYKEFNPVLFNAREWVKTAKDAGMKYIVLTTRHHDGFSLWDSNYSDYDMAATPYGKGIVKELADECKKQNIDFGVYYSICDWWHKDYPVEYPSPDYKFHIEKQITDPALKAKMDRYVQYMKNQLKELIENYDPTMIWFDGEWEWAWTHEMGMDMYAYLRTLKDDLLINNRVDKGREGMRGITKSEIFAGDYATPEQQIGKFDNKNAWETCMTIANQWAWKANDKLKSEKECIQTLLQTIGGDGNLLFNVGPMADGRIEQRQIDRLKTMGDWLKINKEAVYGTRGGPYQPTDYMVTTRKDNKIYIHLLNSTKTHLKLPFPKNVKINKAYFLDGNIPLLYSQDKNTINISLPEQKPNDIASVIVLELNKPTLNIEVISRINY
ncbi:alpha-L-fucosidase [Tamlana sp. 2201CG12-4]|uniref:alpha-L-fucosidase n=1 Tax=Tamlana sp. 2201CG12-4 TaxID=3112582 RepID=UPI002DBA13DF|nr:alpha-L-fucosidase [Tamlana sp. 2201CG12-4]MEC3908466.1 alpha-L-fucosidase [Tamlana sp. 2201CG12-4]